MAPSRRLTRNRFTLRPDAIALAVAVAFQAAPAFAGPQGGVVQAGSASIVPTGAKRLDIIQSSQRAVIDWRSFSIGAGEHVNFRQPSASSATLNRVVGADISAIYGRMTANGAVFLINPNGILIGPGAKLDVGSLVVATANISNANFMAGRYQFDQVVNRNAVIVNRGEITAAAGGLVALVAPGVENSGVIRAQLGKVALASGNAFTLDLFGDKLISFAVDDKVAARLTDADGRLLKSYVNQAGVVDVEGGSVLIAANAAKAVLDNAINVSGVVRATSFASRNGVIVLQGGDEGVVRVSGTLDASGKASGQTGGRVDVLGAAVALEPAGRIDVSGDAGGGAVEVSGRLALEFLGGVDVSARNGRHGALLLDPEFLIVDAATANAIAGVLRTGASEVRMAADTITVAQRIDGRGGAKGGGLTLDAGNRITVDDDIITNDGPVQLKAGAGGIAMGSGPAGSVTNGNGTVIHAGSGAITLEAAGNVTAEHLVTTGAVTVATTAPDATITLAGPVIAGGKVTIGSPQQKDATEIRLRNDIHTRNADIELNGRTWIDPIVQPGETNVFYSRLFRLSSAARYYEIPVVQVALQTDGAGSVRLNGDVLWGGDPANLPQVRYIYNLFLPPASGRPTAQQIAEARARQDARDAGYFGLNVRVRSGTVHFGGKLGMYNAAGEEAFRSPTAPLGVANNGTALQVSVETPSYTNATGLADISFAPNATVKVGRFRIVNPNPPNFDSVDLLSSIDSGVFAVPRPEFSLLPNRGLPNVSVTDSGPNLIGPSPQSVARPSAFASLGALPEIPVGSPGRPPPDRPNIAGRDAAAGDAAAVLRTTVTDEPIRGTDLRSPDGADGAPRDVFGASAPIVGFAAGRTPEADHEYFSQGAFEFVQTLSTRAAAGR